MVTAWPRHLLHQRSPAGPDAAVQDLDVRRVVAGADVLAHLDRGHGVEPPGHLAVVLQPDLHAGIAGVLT
jgi:hypothetical protein